MTRNLISMIVALILLAGCGYHVSGTGTSLPEGVSAVRIDLFENRTSEPYLDALVTQSISYRLLRLDNIELVEKKEDADASLTGSVIQYSVAAIAYDALDNIEAYRVTIKVEAALERLSDGKILWQGQTIRYQDFRSGAADITLQHDLELATQVEVSNRIAEDLSWQMATGFGGE